MAEGRAASEGEDLGGVRPIGDLSGAWCAGVKLGKGRIRESDPLFIAEARAWSEKKLDGTFRMGYNHGLKLHADLLQVPIEFPS